MKHFSRRIATALLGISILFGSAGLSFPKQAHAQWVVSDPTNLIQNTLSAVNSAAGHVKDYILDTLVWQVGNLAIQSMTKSLVNWINSGFQGSPAFATDLEQNLQGIGDAVARQFFEELAMQDIVTTPFQDKVLDVVRLGYYLHTSPESFYTRYPYTLNQVSANDRAFLQGDFSQGGWNAWFATAMNLPNNPYGAETLANDALTRAVSSATNNRLQELSWNRGFLSWRGECKSPGALSDKITSNVGTSTVTGSVTGGGTNVASGIAVGLGGEDPCLGYAVETPGSVIMEQLNTQLGSGVNRLVSADEFNEIVGALLNQLVLQVVGGGSGGGLSGVSRPSSGGGASFIEQATSPSQNDSTNIRNTFIATVTRQQQQVANFKSSWERIKTAADAVAPRCAATGSPNAGEVRDRAAQALVIAGNATAALNAIQAEIAAVSTAGGNQSLSLLDISKRYNDLTNSGTLPSPEAIAEAGAESQDTGDAIPGSLYTQMTRLAGSASCRALGE